MDFLAHSVGSQRSLRGTDRPGGQARSLAKCHNFFETSRSSRCSTATYDKIHSASGCRPRLYRSIRRFRGGPDPGLPGSV